MDPLFTAKEQLPMVTLSEGGALGEEYMVVPTLGQKVPWQQLDEFLLENNFEGLTGTIISPPPDDSSILCTIDGGGGQQSNTAADRNQRVLGCQDPVICPQFCLTGESGHSSSTSVNFTGHGDEQPFDIGLGDGRNGSPFDAEDTVDTGRALWEEEQRCDFPQLQFTEFENPYSNWLTENADLGSIARMAVENEQQCQILDQLLEQNELGCLIDSPSNDERGAPNEDGVIDADGDYVLRELYREAQQLQCSMRCSTDDDGDSQLLWPPAAPPVAPELARLPPVPRFHLADHDFGLTKRGRPLGSSARRRPKAKGVAVLRTKKRLQNREAALRYRLKKRSEKMEKEGELEQLQKRNQHLKNEKHSLSAEVAYLRELLVEIKTLKGL